MNATRLTSCVYAIAICVLSIGSSVPTRAGDWITWRSTYTHDPNSGMRVEQYARPVEPLAPDQGNLVRSGYRHYRSTIQGSTTADNMHVVYEWVVQSCHTNIGVSLIDLTVCPIRNGDLKHRQCSATITSARHWVIPIHSLDSQAAQAFRMALDLMQLDLMPLDLTVFLRMLLVRMLFHRMLMVRMVGPEWYGPNGMGPNAPGFGYPNYPNYPNANPYYPAPAGGGFQLVPPYQPAPWYDGLYPSAPPLNSP